MKSLICANALIFCFSLYCVLSILQYPILTYFIYPELSFNRLLECPHFSPKIIVEYIFLINKEDGI